MENIYSLRKSFSIIGLTGRIGSGCSEIASILSLNNEDFFSSSKLRTPDNIVFSSDPSQKENIFKRKYNICYNFLKINRIPYVRIDYKKALILYCIYQIAKSDSKYPKQAFAELIASTFTPAEVDNKAFAQDIIQATELISIMESYNFDSVVNTLNEISENDIIKIKSEHDFNLFNIF